MTPREALEWYDAVARNYGHGRSWEWQEAYSALQDCILRDEISSGTGMTRP